jgi:hypothetical protein
MLNQTILVGKVDAVGTGEIMLAVQKNYKNKDGEYDTNYFRVFFPDGISESLALLEKDMTVAIKGRLEQEYYTAPLQVWADKLSFL